MFLICKHIYFSKDFYKFSMNWKQFLKPDLRKIVIFVVLLVLSEIGFYKYWTVGGSYDIILLSFIIIFVKRSSFSCGLDDNCWNNSFYVAEVLNIVFWYLLSCLVVWIYDKYFKKVKKK